MQTMTRVQHLWLLEVYLAAKICNALSFSEQKSAPINSISRDILLSFIFVMTKLIIAYSHIQQAFSWLCFSRPDKCSSHLLFGLV